jgi:metallophosphoesterase superfamily enzyme
MMGSLQIISDLHLKAPAAYDVFEIAPKAPHLVLIGDIGCTQDAGLFTFLEKQLTLFKTVFFVAGNHEPYHTDWSKTKQQLQDFEQRLKASSRKSYYGQNRIHGPHSTRLISRHHHPRLYTVLSHSTHPNRPCQLRHQ